MPKLWQKPVFPLLQPMATEPVEEGEIANASGQGLVFDGGTFDRTDFDTVHLSGCKFKNCSFYKTSWNKALIEQCSFVNCNFEGCYWQGIYAKDCKFVGCTLTGAVLKDTAFINSLLQYVNLNGGLLRSVLLEKTRLVDSEFSECRLQNLQPAETDFSGTNCFKTYFSGVDLTDTEIGGVTLSSDYSELRGAVITARQAGGLVRLLGIKVLDSY